ncbi:MAG TPA: diguanylate cyclase [Steroidobacteraceae bacterium]
MTEAPTAPASLDARLLGEALRNVPDGVAIVESRDGITVLAYGNATLAGLLRRPESWFADRPLVDVEVEAPAGAAATANGTTGLGLRVRLKRVDGTLVECERWAMMLPGNCVALYYRPVPKNSAGALAAALERTSGLSTEEHLLDLLGRDWSIGQRDGRTVTLMRFEIDSWQEYQDTFGRGLSENVLRQVGRTIGAVTRRASDVVAKCGHDGFLVLGVGMDADCALGFAERIVARVRALSVHHPRSATGRFLTVSAGVITVSPPRDVGCQAIVDSSARALEQARAGGGNRAFRASLSE